MYTATTRVGDAAAAGVEGWPWPSTWLQFSAVQTCPPPPQQLHPQPRVAADQLVSNTVSELKWTASLERTLCHCFLVSDIAPVPATPPRPPSGVSGVTASLLRSKKQQAAAPPMSGGVNHYGTCTGGGSNSNVGSGGGSHQRDSGHASIGSSEDLAPAPPLPPRYDHSIECFFFARACLT